MVRRVRRLRLLRLTMIQWRERSLPPVLKLMARQPSPSAYQSCWGVGGMLSWQLSNALGRILGFGSSPPLLLMAPDQRLPPVGQGKALLLRGCHGTGTFWLTVSPTVCAI